VGFAKLHVFPFSPREGTPAAGFGDQVPGAVKRARAAELRDLGRDLRGAFIAAQMGRTHPVLVETEGLGYSTNYLRLRVPGAAEGELHRVTVTPEALADRWAGSP
jgi:threonylcarbamoyladenosine tRNA methylthiotransferase MtaB